MDIVSLEQKNRQSRICTKAVSRELSRFKTTGYNVCTDIAILINRDTICKLWVFQGTCKSTWARGDLGLEKIMMNRKLTIIPFLVKL